MSYNVYYGMVSVAMSVYGDAMNVYASIYI